MNLLSGQTEEAFSRAAAEGRPVFLLDEGGSCVVSGCPERLAVGETLGDYLLLPDEDGGFYEGSMFRLGRMFCVRCVKYGSGKLGEILDDHEISFLMQLTDGMRTHAAFHRSMEYDLSVMWEKKGLLQKHCASQEAELLFRQLEKSLYRVSVGSRNSYEYMNLMYSAAPKTVVDIARLCRELASRCGELLSSAGRSVMYIGPQAERMYVRSTARCALAAVLNGVQNSLLYSPRSSVPKLEVSRSGRYIQILIENKNRCEGGISVEVRGGYGIPIIRRFAALTGGSLELNLEGSTATLKLLIPAATEEEIAEYALEEAASYEYRDGVPDYIRLQMSQVVYMYE